jgi:hypothetical protein
MGRAIQKDFDEFWGFLKDYTLNEPLNLDQFKIQLKTQHKKLFAIMIYMCELDFQNSNDFQSLSKSYAKETLSDLIQSLFCWCNGMYKPGYLSLRSAIETFTKAVIGNQDNSIFIEKSMYAVFERAKINSWFNSSIGIKYFSLMHSNYVDLCKSVHSATVTNLEHISSLGILPKYDDFKSKEFYNLFISTSDCILAIILLNCKETCNKMHHANKQIYLDAIPKEIKKEIRL